MSTFLPWVQTKEVIVSLSNRDVPPPFSSNCQEKNPREAVRTIKARYCVNSKSEGTTRRVGTLHLTGRYNTDAFGGGGESLNLFCQIGVANNRLRFERRFTFQIKVCNKASSNNAHIVIQHGFRELRRTDIACKMEKFKKIGSSSFFLNYCVRNN